MNKIRTESLISAKKAVNNIRKHGLGICSKLIYHISVYPLNHLGIQCIIH